MALSNDLVSQFVKITNDKPEEKQETTVYGTTVVVGDKTYVRFDGSDLLTPVSTTSDVKDNERVTVMVKNHTAIITGNVSSPSASSSDVKEIGNKISEFEIVIADKVSTQEFDAEKGRIDDLVTENVLIKERLTATEADISYLETDNLEVKEKLEAAEASIGELEATKLDAEIADITYATIDDLDVTNADIHNLEATYGEFADLTTKKFEANEATIKELESNMMTTESLEANYANIDFANIGDAAIQNLYSKSGIIKDLVVKDGVISGELVVVTIDGDLIKADTIVADKLVIKGTDGLYYRINTNGETTESSQTDYNSLNGSVIKAKSVTASKINVVDLAAFEATIGGFHIDDDSIYSGVKSSIDNTTEGIHLSSDGQLYVGDANEYIKYYKDQNGNRKLAISAQNIILRSKGKTVEEVIEESTNIEVGARNLIRNSTTLIFADYGFHSTVYPIDVDVENGVMILTAYSNSTSTFAAEIIDGVLAVAEEYETEATVNAEILDTVLSVD